jgi:hypothetical protein
MKNPSAKTPTTSFLSRQMIELTVTRLDSGLADYLRDECE